MKKKSWKFWLKGLISAAVGGGAGGVVMVIVDPTDFNFGAGLWRLLQVVGAFAIVAAAGYLQKHPVPDDPDDTISTVGRTAGLWLVAAAAIGALLTSGCGAKKAVTVDQARVVLYESLAAVQDVEMALYQGGQIARPAHQAFNAQLLPTLEAARAADRVLRTWSSGAPPIEIQMLIARVGELAETTARLLPDGPPKTAIVDRIQKARALIDSVLGAITGGGR